MTIVSVYFCNVSNIVSYVKQKGDFILFGFENLVTDSIVDICIQSVSLESEGIMINYFSEMKLIYIIIYIVMKFPEW